MEPRAAANLDAIWPPWISYAFAGVAVALAVVVAVEPRPGIPVGARVALSAAPAVVWVICCVRRVSVVVTVGVAVGAVAALLTHPASFDAAPFFLVLVIGETVSDSPLAAAVVASASAALLAGFELAGRFEGSVIWVLAFAFTWAGASLVQSRLRLLDVVSERAVAAERQRIARELHDVIAHSLAVTMLQLTGARLALERDPEDAARALAEAERLGRQSLAEIRRTVGLLAPSDEAPSSALPTASDVPALVREMTDAGLAVDMRCEGELSMVAPAPGLAVYRILQESLANVVKHGPPGASASIEVAVTDGNVRLRIANPTDCAATAAASDHTGMGLRSMRERAESLGGTFAAGIDADAWCVAATVPREIEA